MDERLGPLRGPLCREDFPRGVGDPEGVEGLTHMVLNIRLTTLLRWESGFFHFGQFEDECSKDVKQADYLSQ